MYFNGDHWSISLPFAREFFLQRSVVVHTSRVESWKQQKKLIAEVREENFFGDKPHDNKWSEILLHQVVTIDNGIVPL